LGIVDRVINFLTKIIKMNICLLWNGIWTHYYYYCSWNYL